MKSLDLDAECDFQGLSSEEIETVCTYEYMRESRTLKDALNARTEDERKKISRELPSSPFFLSLTEAQFVRLMLALRTAGFPKPWKRLSKKFQKQLVSLLAKSRKGMRGDKAMYPPVVIEDASPEFDHFENHWRVGQLEPFELSLFKGWEHSGRRCFFGFIRIDEAYNETEAVEAFKKEFSKRWGKTKGGNREIWGARLKNLAVMRLRKRFPGRGYLELYKRLNLVAEFCGYKGCVTESEAYNERRSHGRGDEPISKAAEAEMSSARIEARTFFQSLFPGEKPLSWHISTRGKVNSNQKSGCR